MSDGITGTTTECIDIDYSLIDDLICPVCGRKPRTMSMEGYCSIECCFKVVAPTIERAVLLWEGRRSQSCKVIGLAVR